MVFRGFPLFRQPFVVAHQQLFVVAVQVHAVAQTVAEEAAIGAFAAAGPFAVAELPEPVRPHLPEVVAIDVSLYSIYMESSQFRGS